MRVIFRPWTPLLLILATVGFAACSDDRSRGSTDGGELDGGRSDAGDAAGVLPGNDGGGDSGDRPRLDMETSDVTPEDGGPENDGGATTACAVDALGGILNDTSKLPPPSAGPMGYNTFVPPATDGATFVDPVFGSTVMRVSNDGDSDDLYARNMWWSADGSRYLHRNKNGTNFADFWDVIDVATGVVTHENIPIGGLASDSGFDPVDPDVLYRLSSGGIEKITLQPDGTWSTEDFFTPPNAAPLKSLGGTMNWIDASGRYMLIRYGDEPSVHLYDTRDMAAGPYDGAIDGSNTVGAGSYVGVMPSGRYLAGYTNAEDWAVNSTGTEYGLGTGVSWEIDHANRSIGAPNYFWNLCGDHGTFISPSDGRDYMILSGCISTPGVFRVDVAWDAVGKSEEEQLAHNMLLVDLDWGLGVHMAAVARGPLKDWGFISSEDGDDDINAGSDDGNGFITPWKTWGQEIIAFNVLTGDVRRLAHHRSRGLGDYVNMPRVSVSWGGEYVGWQSNFNQAGSNDTYATPFCVSP